MLRKKMNKSLTLVLFFALILGINRETMVYQSSCEFKSGCQRKPGKMLKLSTEGGQQNKFILTS